MADILAGIENEHVDGESYLTDDQRKLLEEIAREFTPQDNAADLGILYEITGFQADVEDEFWKNYDDFDELGGTNLVQPTKNEKANYYKD